MNLDEDCISDNIAYTLRAYALVPRDIAPFSRNVVYAGNVYAIVSKRLKEGDDIMKLNHIHAQKSWLNMKYSLYENHCTFGQIWK